MDAPCWPSRSTCESRLLSTAQLPRLAHLPSTASSALTTPRHPKALSIEARVERCMQARPLLCSAVRRAACSSWLVGHLPGERHDAAGPCNRPERRAGGRSCRTPSQLELRSLATNDSWSIEFEACGFFRLCDRARLARREAEAWCPHGSACETELQESTRSHRTPANRLASFQ